MPEKSDKQFVNIAFEGELLKKIDDFRFSQRFPTRTEAIRWLIEFAIKQKPKVAD